MNFSKKNHEHKNNTKIVVSKNLRVTTTIVALAFVGLTTMSCKDGKENSSATTDTEMIKLEPSTSTAKKESKIQNPESEKVLADYMTLKNALVETDKDAATEAGKKLEITLKSFTLDNYSADQKAELEPLVASAIEHSEKIAKSNMEEQRAHFQKLNDAITNMVAITGTENTLYQQFCPMYAGDTGGAWLSTEKNIRNPYFGSKMMKCGVVQKEIN
ncbi:DUF3347 domain-containing protein [Gelidibacter sp.]|uniref:DUF3347 domain-containing protein n=1 Tax=Gelidibacter sp. TaxID=2018083 RepID=UPI002C758E14|nr:DUF3347 domain-containing protein [Gelidibacter sp.]HUH29354.1 DUF3347 domain-containing protein [Gelidibacter sp.]